MAKNGMPWNSTRLTPGSASKITSKKQMATLVGSEPDHHATQEPTDCSSPIHTSVVAPPVELAPGWPAKHGATITRHSSKRIVSG